MKHSIASADFHDLSPRGFHHHSPTPWVHFRFLIFYQFPSFMATTVASFVEEREAPAPHRRTEAAARRAECREAGLISSRAT